MASLNIQLFSNDDILFLSTATFTNLVPKISSSANQSINFLTKLDHVTGKTLWANSYQYTDGVNEFLLVSNTLKNENIWIVLSTGKLLSIN